MQKLYLLILPAVAILLTGCQAQQSESFELKIMSQIQLESPAFLDQSQIPSKYTCDGEDVSPALRISDVPDDVQSLALIVDDPDAPSGNWAHWLMWNIGPDTDQISENTVPAGAVQGMTDFNQNKYGGPCPPSGTHRYQFKLYALDSQLNLDSNTRKQNLEKAMQGHILDQALLVGLYKRE